MHALRRKVARDSHARYRNAPEVHERTKQDFTPPQDRCMRKTPTNGSARNQTRPRHGYIALPRTIIVGFTVINESFICKACGASVPPAKSTCRNHCNKCLVSQHVDDKLPGDRASGCKGLMKAIRIEGTDPDRLILTHKCMQCGKVQRNKVASDDDKEAIFSLFQQIQ